MGHIHTAMELWQSRWAVEIQKQVDHVIPSKLTPIVNGVTDLQNEISEVQTDLNNQRKTNNRVDS